MKFSNVPSVKHVPAALSLGGNLGDVLHNFDTAIIRMEEAGICEIRKSSVYKTPPLDCPPESPDFFNAAITGLWPGKLDDLFALCKKLEREAGRMHGKTCRNTPRPLDIDIILFGQISRRDSNIVIPHPSAAKRFFVMIPLAEIAPDWIFPKLDRTVRDLLADLGPAPDYAVVNGDLNIQLSTLNSERFFHFKVGS